MEEGSITVVTRPADTSGGVDAVDRALSILATFAAGRERQTLAQLAAATGLYKSTILRLARSLEHGGFLHREADGLFSVGPQPLRLSAVYRRGLRLEEMVRPVLRALVGDTGESASFYRREGDRRVCLFREESARTIRDHVAEGDLLRLDRGAAGHALTRGAAAMRASAIGTIVSHGEGDPDVAAVAAAIFNHDGLAGAVTVSGPRGRFDEEKVAAVTPVLMASARSLTESLGGAW